MKYRYFFIHEIIKIERIDGRNKIGSQLKTHGRSETTN